MQLLQLPTEVRLKILELLLFRSEPLTTRPVPCPECVEAVPQVAVYTHLFEHRAQKKTLGLYTEVLRTCKRIRDEGTPILYANTAAAKVWLEDSLGPWVHSYSHNELGRYQRISIGLAQYGLRDQAESLKGLQPRLSNLHLTIKSDWNNDNDVGNSNESFYDNIATLIHSTKQLKRLNLKFELPPDLSDSESERQTAHYELIQDRLRPVRGISFVQVTGNVPEAFATQLAASMMEREPVPKEVKGDMVLL
jgi:hypothetical protein